MTFTDDNLKRLKERLQKTLSPVDAVKVIALLARLEAAERVIKEADNLEAEHCCEDCPCGYIRMSLETWRKACGRDQ